VFAALNADGRDPNDVATLAADLAEHRNRLHDLLVSGTRKRDKTTARFCRGLIAHETALWTFTTTPGVPATKNAAERALRHAVMWRKTSYGTQNDHGNRLTADPDGPRDLPTARPPPAHLPHQRTDRRTPPPTDPSATTSMTT
jgi:Transposase IS66 family